jgi:hypothetical protein
LRDVIENYNNSMHRGLGMTPLEASKKENKKLVLANQEKYRKEFVQRTCEKFCIGKKC